MDLSPEVKEVKAKINNEGSRPQQEDSKWMFKSRTGKILMELLRVLRWLGICACVCVWKKKTKNKKLLGITGERTDRSGD